MNQTELIRRALHDLHRLNQAGELRSFQDRALPEAMAEWNERRRNRTIGQDLFAAELGDLCAKLLGLDRATCCRLSEEYMNGTRAEAVGDALHAFADRVERPSVRRLVG